MKTINAKIKPNQFRALLALTKASVLNALRNPSSLFFNFFFPFIFITIFGLLGNGTAKFDIALKADSMKEGPVVEAIKNVSAFNLVENRSDSDIEADLKKGQLPVALIITKVPANSTVRFDTYKLDVERSAAAPTEAQTITSIVDAIVSQINTSAAGNVPKLITKTETLVEGRKYKQIDFILPGQLAFALLSNALFGIAFTFITYKKELILKRYFATPIKKSTIMAAEILSKAVIAMLQSIIIIGAGRFIYGFTLANGLSTFISMMVLSLIGIMVFLAFGLLVPILGKTEDSVSPISNLIMMPQLFLSGAFFPVEAFPSFLQPIAKIMPMTFLNNAFRKVAFEGASLTETLPMIGGLLIWGVVIYIIDIKFFKWD